MLSDTDVPLYSQLSRLKDVLGSADTDLPLVKYMSEVDKHLQSHSYPVMVDAATGAGKGVLLPSHLQISLAPGKLLCLCPETIGVENMQAGAHYPEVEVPKRWRQTRGCFEGRGGD